MIDAVRTAVLQRRLEGIADEMGVRLVRASLSSNIKERMDCSTALFDATGTLLSQAAHIPVHLGSMSHAVRAVLPRCPQAGDAWVLNDPYDGGTHLPDITVVAPVHVDTTLVGYAAARAHHADVGGETAGSMAASSATIDSEGVRIEPVRIRTEAGVDGAVIHGLVGRMRQPDERRGDLLAQLAALDVAQRRLSTLVAGSGGAAQFARDCAALVDAGERRMAAALAQFEGRAGQGAHELEHPGTDRAFVRASVRVRAGVLHVDLRSSSPQLSSSLNCPVAVTHAATMFAVRVAIDPSLPGSGGVERRVQLQTEPGTIVAASYPAAVAGGNVEVSSVVVEALFDALGDFCDVPASGQATMNNLVIGNDRFSYYETIAGGQGGSRFGPGPHAVQVAMTNTRNTPLEALEHEFPFVVQRYAVRRGSGGAGRHPGGDGVVRELRVLERCNLNLMAQSRNIAPAGRDGGCPGAPGAQFVNDVAVSGFATLDLRAGDKVRIETPGGGGYGEPTGS